MPGSEWADANFYYACYCIAHGAKSKEEMLKRDRAKYPGGTMTGFVIWNSVNWREWRRENGLSAGEPVTRKQRLEFEAWLQSKILSGLYAVETDKHCRDCGKVHSYLSQRHKVVVGPRETMLEELRGFGRVVLYDPTQTDLTGTVEVSVFLTD